MRNIERGLATMLGLLALLLCGTALACPNPSFCPGTTYDIEYAGEDYHLLVCTVCGYKVVYSHSGGQATCTKRAICEGCGHEYGPWPIGQHKWGEYTPDGNATCTADGTKTAKCSNCRETDTIPDAGSALGHSFTSYTSDGDATCTLDGTKTAYCDHGCGATDTAVDFGSALGHSFTYYTSNGDAACTVDGTKTAYCDRGCGATDTISDVGSALGHSFTNYTSNGDATCTEDGTKTAYCDRGCGATDTISDVGSALGHSFTNYTSNGDATCTEDGTKTAHCDRGCGATDIVADAGSALGHEYRAVVTAPTCIKSGHTTYICNRCNDSYKADKTAARQHWYGLWSYEEDMTHGATCLRDGCGYVRTRDCTFYTVTVGDDLFNICPVCGNLNGIMMSPLKAAVANADNDAVGIPERGELIVRGLEEPFDGVLYALTFAYEYAGNLEEFTGTVRAEIHLALTDELPRFQLVRVNVPMADENTEVTEDWTEIKYSYEDGALSFNTDAAGVFLLLPVE